MRLLVKAITAFAACWFSTQAHGEDFMHRAQQIGQGAVAAEWCMTKATNRIHQQTMSDRGVCPRYLLGWGNSHQNDLGRDALQAIICENNLPRAIDYLQVCQCHNKQWHNALPSQRSQVAQWARERFPSAGMICPQTSTRIPSQRPPTQPICACRYNDGTIGLWFSGRPNEYGSTGSQTFAASQCQRVSLCQQFDPSGQLGYSYITSPVTMNVTRWSTHRNPSTGFEMYSAWSK